jgi:hypothetical protein
MILVVLRIFAQRYLSGERAFSEASPAAEIKQTSEVIALSSSAATPRSASPEKLAGRRTAYADREC